jgi:acetyl esterase/lipase
MDDRSVLGRPAPPPTRRLAYGDGPDQVVDVWEAERHDRPVVAVIHGGYWRPAYDRAHLGPMCDALATAGWDCAAIEYRRIPGDPDAMLDDVRDALAAVSLHAAGRPVIVLGHSAGGHLALWAAATCPPEGLLSTIALAPVANLRRAEKLVVDGGAVSEFLGRPVAERPDVDPMMCPTPASPVTVIHGDADGLVPLELAQSYCERHGAAFVVVEGADHFSVIDPLSRAWPVIIDALAHPLD